MMHDLTDENEEIAGWYAEAYREVRKKLRRHKGPWPDWVQDVVQEAVFQAWQADTYLPGEKDPCEVLRSKVRREIDKELLHQKRRNA